MAGVYDRDPGSPPVLNQIPLYLQDDNPFRLVYTHTIYYILILREDQSCVISKQSGVFSAFYMSCLLGKNYTFCIMT